MFHRAQKGWTWRAIVASAAAYSLALNLFAAGALGGRISVAAAASDGFEICLGHSGDADQQSPALPDTGKLHCVLCVVATHAPVVPRRRHVDCAHGVWPLLEASGHGVEAEKSSGRGHGRGHGLGQVPARKDSAAAW